MLQHVHQISLADAPKELQDLINNAPGSQLEKQLGQLLFHLALLEHTGDLSPAGKHTLLHDFGDIATEVDANSEHVNGFAQIAYVLQERLNDLVKAKAN